MSPIAGARKAASPWPHFGRSYRQAIIQIQNSDRNQISLVRGVSDDALEDPG
jgi:hypothetical protein